MQCRQCQAENRAGRRFCTKCGAPLAAPCPACGFTNESGDVFCGECGAALGGSGPAPAAPPPVDPRFTTPETYTPQHLAERILTSRTALEGERKQVTVLFADLKGSMELLADRDPEEARAILDPVLERMMEAVHRYEGTVNQVMGDGIMALFGAPLAHEDHAVRACYAALRMQEVVKAYAKEVQRAQGLPLHIRVGLNSGEVLVRSIGSDLRMDYTAVGQTTHLAARMEQIAMPGSILLAPGTLQLAEGYVQVQALGPMAIKGLSEPVAVYELAGTGAARSRLHAAAARGLSKFVGRETELDTLRRTLDQAASGHGQIVALVGEPGVGKSRLVWELSHSHRTQGWLVLETGSVSYGKATSYLPVIDLLQSYCGIESRDDPRRIREKLLGKILNLAEALRPTVPALLALLDVPTEDPVWEALDPPQRRQRILDACKQLLLRESQEQPLLLVCEDLHWIDSETQALLDSLVESLPTARILLLVNYRPEYEHTWHRKTYYTQLRLAPLPPASAEALLESLLGTDAGLGPLRRLLVERTEGNPFFQEESVRSLVETGVLAGERGAYRVVKPLASTQVPATVQAVLAARIDRLAPEDKRLLQAAAVIGKDVPFVLLQAIAELREDPLRQGLARLQAAEFLYETNLFPELEYTFKHALTHEVAYGGQLQDRRRALHAQILHAYESLYPDHSAEHVGRLAAHGLHGEVWDKAVRYAREAGEKAAGHSAYREAVSYFEQALAALGHLPPSRAVHEQAIDLRIALRNALLPLGEQGQVIEHLQAAEVLADAVGDERRLGLVAAYTSASWWWAGDYEPAAQAGGRALAIGDRIGDLEIQALANFFLGHAYYDRGDYRRASEHFRRNVEALQGDLARERFGMLGPASLGSGTWLLWCLAETGDFAEGISRGEEYARLAEAVDQPFSIIMSFLPLGALYLQKGNIEPAAAVLARCMQLCQAMGIRYFLPQVASALGHTYALAGQVTEGLALLEHALEAGASMQGKAGHSRRFTWTGEACLRARQADAATQHGEHALQLARQSREQGNEAWALRLLGEIAIHTDRPDVAQAESYYRQALALADELGMRPLVAHCHLGLGTLYRKISRDEQARAELATAAEMYRAMEMTFWLERAETELEQMASAP
jgi:class 3 adenylate cyclase/tetratricopeptide (TPR) repeat protein